MINIGILILVLAAAALAIVALRQGTGVFALGIERAIEQGAHLIPRMICALIAAGFVAKLMPSDLIARYLGGDAGFSAILVATAAGLILPAGPVIAFSIAAVFARAGASVPALIAFITSWALFSVHRIFMYEIPLLGVSFMRMRLAAVAVAPILAGLIALAVGLFVTFAQPAAG
jgi:uncharacterized membrane protein YraQ (UPF0718 family)